MTDYRLRPAIASDQRYVAHSWVCSAGSVHDRELNHTVDRLLDDPRTVVSVACATTDSDRILGWVASARIPGARVLEYVLVRRSERGKGIGRELLRHAGLSGAGPRVVALFKPHGSQIHMPPSEFLL